MSAPAEMPVIVIGGCAAGTVLPAVRSDAQFIELSAPLHAKPLTSPDQEHPEFVEMRDRYEIHPLMLVESDVDRGALLGIAAVEGMSLTAAFSHLISAYSSKMFDEAVAKRKGVKGSKQH